MGGRRGMTGGDTLQRFGTSDIDRTTLREVDQDFDREYYNMEEAGMGEADYKSPFQGDHAKWDEMERRMRAQRRGEKKQAGLSARQSALNRDQEAWERNRLFTSGVIEGGDVNDDFDDDLEARVQLMVHNVKPPFLDGRVEFTTQLQMVSTVKDPSSDIAVLAKKGSEALKRAREMRERSKMRKRFWELGGSKMGDAIGIKKEEEVDDDGPKATTVGTAEAGAAGEEAEKRDAADKEGEEEVNYKEDSQYVVRPGVIWSVEWVYLLDECICCAP